MVGVTTMMLLLTLGLVLDLGHLYIVKTELQNAADACALSAARELATISAATAGNARTAGRTVGGMNRVNFQSDAVDIQDADITFSAAPDSGFGDTVASDTRYVKCTPHGTNTKSVVMWFMVLAGIESWNMSASAVARLGPSQSHCAIPLAVCAKNTVNNVNLPCSDASHPCWGLTPGEWRNGRFKPGEGEAGAYNWIRYNGQGARDLAELLEGDGLCDLSGHEDFVRAEPGFKNGIDVPAWNTRFGLYKDKNAEMIASPPDWTGFAYTTSNWAAGKDAYGNFLQKRDAYAPCNTADILDDKGKPAKLPASISSTDHHDYGKDRRMATVPIVDCSTWKDTKKNEPVLGWGCALMLAPIQGQDDVVLEFVSRASDAACASSGIPGGAGGALVAQLVR
jgi:Flp pilus assembly protein TadG